MDTRLTRWVDDLFYIIYEIMYNSIFAKRYNANVKTNRI